MRTLQRIADMLQESMGLDMATVGASLIERAVRERMALLQIDDDEHYLLQLQASPAQLQQLIELAVVPETWFFRDREAMLALARLAAARYAALPGQPVRILSAPCSTGEEPYSVAMALFDAGLTASSFHIDAIDIRTQSLAIAAEGVYGRNSFRGRELGFRERYFTPEGEDWRIQARVKAQVGFVAGNLLAADFMAAGAPYDFILCRNLLIYFDRERQHRVVALLEGLMKEEGYLFVGPAEGGILLGPRLKSANLPLAFGFCKRSRREREVPAAAVVLPPWPVVPWSRQAAPASRPRHVHRPLPAGGASPADLPLPGEQSGLVQARRLADQGELARAVVLCEQVLEQHGPDAEVFYLQAVIYDAMGDVARAQGGYRKTLYLQPGHHEALLHLAALLQAQGDDVAARLMRERAERAAQEEKTHG